MIENTTIAAIATGEGGAIATIRVSGKDAITLCEQIFQSNSGKTISSLKGFSLTYGNIISSGEFIDEVIVSIFRAPRSYTGENMVEISCHGSQYIKNKIINALVDEGIKPARPGEFTLRAFLNGKLDLSQAEAVADLIASDSKESHTLAINQMRGGYSTEFVLLREKLLELSSLLELELDFSEEDVEFADRAKLLNVINAIKDRISTLKESFSLGNVLKNGLPVAIVGSPNVGKSTLLNNLLNEERAMVSEIAGTTRDVIEDVTNIKGVQFRFIDTAGIRATDDILENMGIERTFKRIESARVILLVCECTDSLEKITSEFNALNINEQQHIAIILNKSDKLSEVYVAQFTTLLSQQLEVTIIPISARSGNNIETVKEYLSSLVSVHSDAKGIIVTNARHYESLKNAHKAILQASESLTSGITADLLAEDIRDVLHQIGLITGEITTNEILGSIFSKFCIGK